MTTSRWSLLAKMSASIAVFAFVLIGFGIFSAHTNARVQIGGPYYAQISLSKDLVADILPPPAYIIEAYLLTFQAVNAPDAKAREGYLTRLAETEKEFNERQQVWRDALPESRMKAALVVDSAKYADNFFKVVHKSFLPAIQAGKLDTARELANGEMREAYTRHRAYIDEVVTLANQFARDREAEAQSAVRQSTVWEIALGVAGLLVGIVLSGSIVRSLSRALGHIASTLADGADQTSSASAQVSSSSQSLAQGASEQAASLEETSASMEELSSMTKRNCESATLAKELSRETRSAAETGNIDKAEMRLAMEAIKTSSNDISKIIKTIDEIAFQTNILALNAAVEAARAGEAGAGFAVVAEEVRGLAQRSAQSAKESANKIEIAIKSGDHGVSISDKVARSFSTIVEKARRVDELIAEIATASKEQSQGLGQINQAICQMDQVTQSNAANAEETAAAAEELSAQSLSLKDTVSQLRELVEGRNDGSSKSSASVSRSTATSREQSFQHPATFPEHSPSRLSQREP